MKKLRMLALAGMMLVGSAIGGCMSISAEEKAMNAKEKEKFAEMVARKVIEMQKQEDCDNEI